MKQLYQPVAVTIDYVTLAQGEALHKLEFEPDLSEYQKAYGKNGEEVNWTTKDFHCWKPTVSTALKWIRDNYSIYIEVFLDRTSYPKFCTAIWKWLDISDFKKLHESYFLGGFEHLHRFQEQLESEALTFILDYLIKDAPTRESIQSNKK